MEAKVLSKSPETIINGTTGQQSPIGNSPPGLSPYRSSSSSSSSSPITPATIFTINTSDNSINDLKRYKRYIEWCEFYKARPLPEACVAFRHSTVRVLKITDVDVTSYRSSVGSTSATIVSNNISSTSSNSSSNINVTALDLLPCLEMLRFDNVITELDLSGCKVGNSGAIAVGDMLPMTTHLKILAMSSCEISEFGATALLRGVARAPILQRLYLRGNRIGVGGAIGLAMVLRKTKTISFVDVSNNFLTTEGVRLVTQALLSRAQLRLARRVGVGISRQEGTEDRFVIRSRGNSLDLTDLTAGSSVSSGQGFGWLFGEVRGLVITTRSVVKTNWTNWGQERTLSDATSARDAKSYGAILKAQSKSFQPHHLSKQKKSTSTKGLIEEGGDAGHNEGGGGGGGGGVQSTLSHGNDIFGSINTSTNTKQSISSTTNQEEDSLDVDIEVIISGNFRREDLYDAFIHGIGLILSLLGGIVLFIKARQVEGETGTRLLAGYILYEIGLLSLFFSSTLSHSLHMVDAHASLRLLSQSAIYLLIAGSYSPFFLVNLQHVQLGIYLFLAIWALALTGIALATSCGVRKGETIYTYTDRDWSGGRAVVFALMGWLALVPRQLVATCLDERGWKLLLVGGIFFGCGVGLYLIGRAQQVTRHRTVLSFWYILVLLACVIHWFAIYFFVEPPSEICIKAAVDGGLQLREGKGEGEGGGGRDVQRRDEEALLLSTLTQVIEKAVSGGSDIKTLKDIVIEFGEKGREAIVSSLKEVLLLIEGGGGSGRVNESMIVE